jgi:hypothetical protein
MTSGSRLSAALLLPLSFLKSRPLTAGSTPQQPYRSGSFAPIIRVFSGQFFFKMALCKYCGAETMLHSVGTPICIKCANDIDNGHNPPYNRDAERIIDQQEMEPKGAQSVAAHPRTLPAHLSH